MKEIAEHIITKDSAGETLTGEKKYWLQLPPDIPACNFWSVIVYDNETHLIIHADQPWPSVYSSSKRLVFNQDGSVDVWFGPNAPPGKENNWIQTIPGKGWYMIMRLYEPLETWVSGIWRPGKIEQI